MTTEKGSFNSEGWGAEWNEKGFIKEVPSYETFELEYFCKEDGKLHNLARTDYRQHCYPGTNCVDWSEYMFEDKEVAIYYCSKNNEIYESNPGDTIADQHPDEKDEEKEEEEEIYDTLEEAFQCAFVKAAGVEGWDVPIFRNSDGRFEVGGYQSPNYRDISEDGSFDEIGRVHGWDVDEYEYEEVLTDDEKGEIVYQSNGSDAYAEFCEQYGIE